MPLSVIAEVSSAAFLQVLGRTHPLFVHLPLGLVLGAAVAEAVRTVQRRRQLSGFTVPGLWIAAGGAVAACTSGWFFAWDEGSGAHLFWHRWLGIAVAAFLVALAWMATRATREGSRTAPQLVPVVRIGVFVLAVMVAWVGHLGGNMVWGEDYVLQPLLGRSGDAKPAAGGTAAAADAAVGGAATTASGAAASPAASASAAPEGAGMPSDGPTLYASAVLPLLEDRCYQCHGNGKHKGGLSLDDPESVHGKNDQGEWIANPVNPDGSLMIARVLLPAGHDEAMPPKGERLKPEEVAALRAWIKAGAPMELPKGAPAAPAAAPVARAREVSADVPAFWAGMAPIPSALVEQGAGLRMRGINVAPVAHNAPTFDVSVPGARGFGDADLAALAPFADRIEHLSLARTGVTDAGARTARSMPNVRTLRLDHTALTDEGIGALAAHCPKVEVLNLVGTKASDAVLARLAGLGSLRRLFVWDTRITGSGIDAFRKTHPAVEVIVGAGVPGTSTADGPPLTGP
jgi:mono/diheme cytochrome c family protein